MPPSLNVAVIIDFYGVDEFRGLRKDFKLRARVDRLKKQREITLPNTGLLAVIVIQTYVALERDKVLEERIRTFYPEDESDMFLRNVDSY
jgi:hypothetical protein